jgi:6-pyruvoyltetrahydropterin/6-carboxytetrahydropterin synthase
MLIRKLFKFEGAHIVRNCSSERCKKSIHGHSYVVEVFFTSKGLDNGQMVLDFGLMKGTIKDFIDGFDHAYSMWDKETEPFQQFIHEQSDRWISMPVSPSAEAYSIMFFKVIDSIVKATEFNNGEKEVELYSVRVHETTTGYAEAFRTDLEWVTFNLEDIVISNGIKAEWKDPEMYDKLISYTQTVGTDNKKPFINPVVDQQV